MPAVGETVGTYRIDAQIGSGGMGVVFRAHDLRLDRAVALKFIADHVAADADHVGRFAREVRAAAAVTHPNICTVYDVGEHEGRPYFVMELLEGAPLEHFCQQGPMPLERALEIAGCVAGALDVAHRRGIIHRDIKSANIFVTADGQVKVLDFGLARLGETSAGGALSNGSTAFQTNWRAGMGTVGYMSPEQARGEPDVEPARTCSRWASCCTNSWQARSRFGDRRRSS